MSTAWLHGAALSGARFGPQAEDGFWPVLPGHGEVPRATSTVAAYAAAVAPALPDRFALVGHSLGGMVAMRLAADLPARCRALVLVDVPLRLPFPGARALGGVFARAIARVPGPGGLARVLALRVERAAARPAVHASIAAMSVPGLRDAMRAASRFDAAPLLARLTMPVLALYGARSLLTNAAQRRELTDACPQAETHVMQTGHFTPYDRPDEFAAHVVPFLEAHP